MGDSDVSMFSSDESVDSYNPPECDEESESSSSQEGSMDESSSEEEERGSSPSGSSSTWGPCRESVRKHRFSGGSGLGVQLNVSDPVSVYKHFLNDDVLKLIVDETNRYANQLISSVTLSRRSRMQKWRDTCKSEIQKFIAILIAMGIVHFPKMRLLVAETAL
ncbi:hypothetical protein J437_LFUL016545 [Ladona fulva]|uniref:PiggyBac transposable element-derived protein domain-containing protein n=1 Tax=Ladona fulva TaxID=123851 RepID=A0A8K0KPV6_LADFU|nr:hypothetical protein J437_LFUL016545 [Ladona fulva]